LDPSSLFSKLGGGVGREQWESVVARLGSVVQEEEERAEMCGPHVSDRKERRRRGPKARTKEGSIIG
jgi:hypothetical protein